MKKILFAITFVAVFSCLNAIAQISISGQVSQNDIYTNIEPDSSIQAAAVHLSTLEGTIDIDVDQNGVMDFRFHSAGGGGLGGGSSACTISSFSSENRIMSHQETSLGFPGDQYFTVNVADTLVENFEISSQCSFNTTSGYIWVNNYGYSAGATVTTWEDIGDHYIGFRIKPAFDTLYGWIRISVIPGTMTLKDFACNINEFAGLNESVSNGISIYPIPAHDYLNIAIPEKLENGIICIYDFSGKKIFEDNMLENPKILNVSDFESGVYLICLKTDNKQFLKKFVKL